MALPQYHKRVIQRLEVVSDFERRLDAEVIKGTTSNMTVGTMHTAAADLETSDPPSNVADFYKSKFPGANVTSSSGDHYSIVSTDKKNMLSISIEPRNGKTRIHIAKVAGKLVGSGDSDD